MAHSPLSYRSSSSSSRSSNSNSSSSSSNSSSSSSIIISSSSDDGCRSGESVSTLTKLIIKSSTKYSFIHLPIHLSNQSLSY